MDPRDSFDPTTDLARDTTDTESAGREPPPDDVRTVGTTQTVAGAEGGSTSQTGTSTETGAAHRAGMPGDGAGRREEIGGKTGVYPFSEAPSDLDAPVRTEAEFGQGDRGPEGYDDAGTSEGSPAATAEELLRDKRAE